MVIVITVFSFEVEMVYSKETLIWLCSSIFLIPLCHRHIFPLINNRGSLGYLGTMVNLPGISQEYMDLVIKGMAKLMSTGWQQPSSPKNYSKRLLPWTSNQQPVLIVYFVSCVWMSYSLRKTLSLYRAGYILYISCQTPRELAPNLRYIFFFFFFFLFYLFIFF